MDLSELKNIKIPKVNITDLHLISIISFFVAFSVGFYLMFSVELQIGRFFAASCTVSGFVDEGSRPYADGTAKATNGNGRDCTITLASYGVTKSGDRIEGQFLHDKMTVNLETGESIGRAKLNVDDPGCRTQYDLILGSNTKVPPYFHSSELIGYAYGGSGLCSPPNGNGGNGNGGPPSPSTLAAVCVGGASPQVQLNWNVPAHSVQNVIQRTGAGGSYGDADALGLSFGMNKTSHTDTTVVLGNTYSYRHKPDANVVSNTVQLTITAANCGAAENPKGFHDVLDCDFAKGWACDGDDYSRPLQIHFYQDGPAGTGAGAGTFIGATTANRTRGAGVASACGGNADHGFVFSLPASFKDGASHTLHTYAINIGGGSNVLLSQLAENVICEPPATHLICQDNACVEVDGAGTDECANDDDCAPETHLVCQDNACVSVQGDGADECTTNDDCAPETHLVCQENACVSVQGDGEDECTTDDDCGITVIETHSVCQDNACVEIDGAGDDECSTNAECAPETHLECRNNACASVQGGGADECSTNAQCAPETHLACRNNACVTVQGSGSDRCSDDSDCEQETHLICVQNACLEVLGRGTNECSRNADCREPTPTGTPTLKLEKFGRNVSRNEVGERVSVVLHPNHVIEFTLRVRNDSDAPAENVIVQDVVPQGIRYQGGSATLDGQPTSDLLATTGINIGTLQPDEQAIIRFLGRAETAEFFAIGETVLVNIARTWADDISPLEDRIPIIVVRTDVVIIETGPEQTVTMALVIAAIMSLIYMGYTTTGTFRRREAAEITEPPEGDFKNS